MIVFVSFSLFLFCFFLFLVTLIRCYESMEIMSLCSKTISQVRFQITALFIYLKKGKCFDFNHFLGSLLYFIYHN